MLRALCPLPPKNYHTVAQSAYLDGHESSCDEKKNSVTFMQHFVSLLIIAPCAGRPYLGSPWWLGKLGNSNSAQCGLSAAQVPPSGCRCTANELGELRAPAWSTSPARDFGERRQLQQGAPRRTSAAFFLKKQLPVEVSWI